MEEFLKSSQTWEDYLALKARYEDPHQYSLLRGKMSKTDPWQDIVAPLEHKEYARDFVNESPFAAIPFLAAGAPLWTAAKMMGRIPGANAGYVDPNYKKEEDQSPPSLDEIFAGYEGIGQGIQDLWSGKRNNRTWTAGGSDGLLSNIRGEPMQPNVLSNINSKMVPNRKKQKSIQSTDSTGIRG